MGHCVRRGDSETTEKLSDMVGWGGVNRGEGRG